jgi:hypothetical protein
MLRRLAWIALVAAAPRSARAEPPTPVAPVVLDEFDAEPLDRWRPNGLSGSEVTDAQAPDGDATAVVLRKDAGRPGWIEREVAEKDWRRFQSFAVRLVVEAAEPQPLRVVLFGARGSLVRRLRVAPGRHETPVPVSDFRAAPADVVGDLDDVRRVRIQWDEAGAGTVRLERFVLTPGSRGTASGRKSPAEWASLLFPDGKPTVVESERFAVITDVEAIGTSAKRLLGRLEDAARLLSERYGVRGTLEGDRAPLVVVRDAEAMSKAVARLAEHFGADVPGPKSVGFTVFGVALAVHDPKQGWERPVFVHEATHALAERLTTVRSNGNWVQEGLASAVQVRLHPTSMKVDLKAAFAGLADGKGPFVAWSELFTEKRPPLSRYAQLSTIFEFLAEKHGPRLPAVWEALRQVERPLNEAGSAAVATALGTTATDLEASWREWGARDGR